MKARRMPRLPNGESKVRAKPVVLDIMRISHQVLLDPWRGPKVNCSIREAMVLKVSFQGKIEGVPAFFSIRLPFTRGFSTHRMEGDIYESTDTDFVRVWDGLPTIKVREGDTLKLVAIAEVKHFRDGGEYIQLTRVKRQE